MVFTGYRGLLEFTGNFLQSNFYSTSISTSVIRIYCRGIIDRNSFEKKSTKSLHHSHSISTRIKTSYKDNLLRICWTSSWFPLVKMYNPTFKSPLPWFTIVSNSLLQQGNASWKEIFCFSKFLNQNTRSSFSPLGFKMLWWFHFLRNSS